MTIVDYWCDACGTVRERSVTSPPPGTWACEVCSTPARRVYGGFSLSGRARRAAKDVLDRERAMRTPADRTHTHDHGHVHDHHHHGPGGETTASQESNRP